MLRGVCRLRSFGFLVGTLAAVLIAIPGFCSQGDFYTSYQHAKVIAHLPLSGSPPTQMFLQQEGRKKYLYLQQAGPQGFTVVDVSKPKHPKVLDRVPQQSITMLSSGLAITQKPATATSPDKASALNGEGSRGGGRAPEQVRVLDVSDPAHPKTVQTFDGVTSILPDDARGLIYVANGDGIWILSHQKILRRHMCGSEDAISFEPNCD
jgi:hypothetical protein